MKEVITNYVLPCAYVPRVDKSACVSYYICLMSLTQCPTSQGINDRAGYVMSGNVQSTWSIQIQCLSYSCQFFQLISLV